MNFKSRDELPKWLIGYVSCYFVLQFFVYYLIVFGYPALVGEFFSPIPVTIVSVLVEVTLFHFTVGESFEQNIAVRVKLTFYG